MELSVIVPCFNEAPNLSALVERVEAALAREGLADRAELVLVDDGSTDASWTVLEDLRRRHAFLAVERHPTNRGLPAAWHTGLSRSRGDYVCVLDADLQYRPEEIGRLRAELARTGVDLVQGARAPAGRERDARYLVSRALNRILNALFGMDLRDNKSGFLLCRRQVFGALLEERERFRYFQIFVMVAAHAQGYRYSAVETPFDRRAAGRSAFGRLPVRTILRSCLDLGRAVVAYRLRRPRATP